MRHRCSSAPSRRDARYISRGARRSPPDDLSTAPGIGAEKSSAPAEEACVQPFSQKSRTPTVAKVIQIGLCGVVEADLDSVATVGVRDFWEKGCRRQTSYEPGVAPPFCHSRDPRAAPPTRFVKARPCRSFSSVLYRNDLGTAEETSDTQVR